MFRWANQGQRVRLNDIRRDLASPDVEVRGRALQALAVSLDRQPELREPAREIFRQTADRETNGWLIRTSVVGLERLDGPDATRQLWRRLLSQPDALAAGQVAGAVSDRSHLPMMLALIEARPEFVFRVNAVHACGRMGDARALPMLLTLCDDASLQPSLVQAMSDIGDVSALLWLQSLASSEQPLPQLDERGAVWTLGDIARQAIRRIEHVAGQLPSTGQLPAREGDATAPAGAATGAHRPIPPPLPPLLRPPFRPAFRFVLLLHSSLIPLAAAALEFAWLFGLFALYIFMVGDQRPTFTVSDRFIDAIALPLPMIGLIAAIAVVLTGRAPRAWHKIVACIGGLICGGVALLFGHDLLTR